MQEIAQVHDTPDDLVFGGWDIYDRNCYEEAVTAGVLSARDLEPIRDELSAIRPMPAGPASCSRRA